MIYSFSPFGYEGALVSVEVDLRHGIPAVDVIGLADGSVIDARERMRCAIYNSGFKFPTERVLISLSPADLKKEGAGFDLPIALAVLQASMKIEAEPVMVMGELELSGKVMGVRGVHAAIVTAMAQGIKNFIIPKGNEAEALEIQDAKVFAVENLVEAVNALKGDFNYKIGFNSNENYEIKFMDIPYDHENLKGFRKPLRALQVAIASGCHLMFWGGPGCGKTLVLESAIGLLPNLTVEEQKIVHRIYSLAGATSLNKPMSEWAPFRIPHQTATIEGMCGGGVHCMPGEISLAHNGVLFLDEAAEFRTSVLQMLRVPLESKNITLSRAGRHTTYPANFQLFMAVNPCPCGNFSSNDKICLCSARSIEQYWKKFSSPLLSRIAIRMEIKDTKKDNSSISTAELRKGITNARIKALKRGFKWNDATPEMIVTLVNIDNATVNLHEYDLRDRLNISRLAMTIADISDRAIPSAEDWNEAISLHGKLPFDFEM